MNFNFIVAKVTEVNEKEASVKVKSLTDSGEMINENLLVLGRSAKGNKSYSMPEINDTVLCLILYGDGTNGFVLGSFYDDENLPPITDKNIFTQIFKDGSKIAYDTAKNELTAEIKGTAKIKADKVIIESSDIEIGQGTVEAMLKAETFKQAFDTHTHLGNLGAPTGVPIVPFPETALSKNIKNS